MWWGYGCVSARFITPPYQQNEVRRKGVNDDILSKIFTTSEIKESRPKGNVQRLFPKWKNPPKEKLTTKTKF